MVTSSDVPRALRASLDLRTPADAKRPIGLSMLVPGLLGVAIGVGLVTQPGKNDSGHQAGAVVIGVSGLVALIGGIFFATGRPAAYYEGQGTVWDLKAAPPPPSAVPTGTQL